jgi:hypothetical protein
MRKLPFTVALGFATAAVAIFAATGGAVTVSEHLVSPGTAGVTKFPRNKQNESTVAVNPIDPTIVAAGANDEIQEPLCTPATGGPSSCPFDPFTDSMGVYITNDAGATWSQQILDAHSTTIYTTDGDPALAWGPKPNGSGGFRALNSANGARLYAGTLLGSATFGAAKEQIGLFYSDDNGSTWTGPIVISTRDNPVSFNDKIALTTDTNPSSPFFGRVYVSWTLFKGNPTLNFGESNTFSPEPIVIARSNDGGSTWSKPVQLSSAANNGSVGGRQGSTPEVAPNGDVYVFWDGALSHQSAVMGVRSTDGGKSFTRPFLVSFKSDNPSPLPGARFRDNSFPSADIGSTGKLYVVWTNYSNGHGTVKLATSTNNGASWSVGTAADVTGRSAFYPAVAVNGSNVFIGFNALDDVAAGTSPGAGVVSYDAYYVLDTGSGFGAPVKISATSSDPDASSTNGLTGQFLGDYNGADVGSNGTFWFTWTDTRNADACAAIDAFRAGTGPRPNIYDSCSTDFGNSDIYVATVAP